VLVDPDLVQISELLALVKGADAVGEIHDDAVLAVMIEAEPDHRRVAICGAGITRACASPDVSFFTDSSSS
jgi:hypothetical protein